MATTAEDVSDRTTSPGNSIVVNELLCYLKQKCNVMTIDDLVKLCADFYTSDEVESSRAILSRYVGQNRLEKLCGSEKDVMSRTLAAMVKIFLDPAIHLPTFGAANLSRIPPRHTNLEVNAMLHELSVLRREVRRVRELMDEVSELQQVKDP